VEEITSVFESDSDAVYFVVCFVRCNDRVQMICSYIGGFVLETIELFQTTTRQLCE
jgi:hypothetical protein